MPVSPRQIMIERPTANVFAFVTDPAHDPQWHDTIVKVTPTSDAPLGSGSTFTAVYRPQGSSATYDLLAEMTAYEPGKFSELQASFADPRGRIPALIGRFVLTFRVEPEGSGTRLLGRTLPARRPLAELDEGAVLVLGPRLEHDERNPGRGDRRGCRVRRSLLALRGAGHLLGVARARRGREEQTAEDDERTSRA